MIRIAVVVLNLAWLVWSLWRAGKLKRPMMWRMAAGAWFVLMMAVYFWLGYARSSEAQLPVPPMPLGMAYIWDLLLLLPLMVIILIGETARAAALLLRSKKEKPASPDEAPNNSADPGMSRRQFLWGTAIAAPPALTIISGVAGYFQSQQFRIRELDIPIADLPPELDGYTIAHVSDVHAGKFVDEAHLRRIADAVNNLRADIVLGTGDLIDYSLSDLPNALDAVRRMNAPGGVHMCEGNHDLFQSRQKFEETVRAANVGLLINETESITHNGREIQLAGLRWGFDHDAPEAVAAYGEPPADHDPDKAKWQPWTDDAGAAAHLQALKPQVNPDAFKIVLAHHPHAFDAASREGYDLTLSGHTHGGQLMLSENVGVGPMMYRYWSGIYKKDNAHSVVSNGVGNWLPLRINAPAELIKLTLRRA